jgi:hypothetical protein
MAVHAAGAAPHSLWAPHALWAEPLPVGQAVCR